jgi:tRNA (cmo5U34)-methyltransferase
MDKHNTWLQGEGSRQVELYTRYADVILPDRGRITELVLRLFGYHLNGRQGLSILDLGCGDGIVTERIHAEYPHNVYHLLDGSPAMLEKARERLGDGEFHYVQQSFAGYVDSLVEDQKYDGVFSINAIHHLGFTEKARLFAKLFRELKHGGLLLVSDPVLPRSKRSEVWQFQMWRDAINDALVAAGDESDIGTQDGLPAEYKQKAENKPSGLFPQMRLLEDIGFRDVDCFYKHGIFAVFGGCK